jgi:signal transduction histidine kinase
VTDIDFPRLVSLACHDLRTPLATVFGFARTLARMDDLGDPAARYISMIDQASGQLGELVDELGMVARIEAGRFDPPLHEIDTLELAQAARESLGDDRVAVAGRGGLVSVDVVSTKRGIAALAQAALRHGGQERVTVEAGDGSVAIAPVTATARPVVLADELRDLGAAAAVALVDALGGSVGVEGDTLVVRLPRAGAR